LTVATVAAALAAIALVAYLNNYKEDVRGGTLPTQVLVADRLIPKGTSGDSVATDRIFRPTTVPQADLKPLAVADAAALSSKVATRDIYPGQQITSADFRVGGDALRGRLSGTQRALAVPVDAARGLIGNVRVGDRVDVFGSFGGGAGGAGALRTIAQDVLVLSAPGVAGADGGGGDASAVIVRLSDQQSARMAYAADNGKIWFALRPPTGAEQSKPATVTGGSVAAPTNAAGGGAG